MVYCQDTKGFSAYNSARSTGAFHNIKVDRSVIGSINTGEVKRIDVAMSHIGAYGNEELVKALKEFTEAVINETGPMKR
jgi:hypothetical protein